MAQNPILIIKAPKVRTLRDRSPSPAVNVVRSDVETLGCLRRGIGAWSLDGFQGGV